MFSLIITIISIALVAALAVASLYYGGDAFTKGRAKADASTLVAQAQQIAAANTLYATDNGGNFAADVATLVAGGYLSAEPSVNADVADGAWTLAGASDNRVTIDLADTATAVAEKVTELAAGSNQFGVEDNAGDISFFFEG